MKALIVEDDFISRALLQAIIGPYGEVQVAVNGKEAVEAFSKGLAEGQPFDLICMDIMMPEMDGQEALRKVRELEKKAGIPGPEEVKVIMISALDDPKTVMEAFNKGGASSYIVKPIDQDKLIDQVREFGFIE